MAIDGLGENWPSYMGHFHRQWDKLGAAAAAAGGDDVVLYSAVTPCYCSMFDALGRAVSFEACCQWSYLTSVLEVHLLVRQ